MCGINGIVGTGRFEAAEIERLVGRMNDLLAHRGPDDAGILVDERAGIAFGHRRLSILDLSPAGHQPMTAPDGTSIVFNGEIYNHLELRQLVPDYPYRSTSDTETLLALYGRFGRDMVRRLNGMFAFALLDPARGVVLLAKDRIGKKPLYYAEGGHGLAFSSEIRPLFAALGHVPAFDPDAVSDFLTFGFAPMPETMFRGIRKLEPGCTMLLERGKPLRIESYWEVEFQAVHETTEGLHERIREELTRSVRYRMLSDVPVGAFLSGGVDSSAVVAMMASESTEPFDTFSVGFENQPGYDETRFARDVSRRYGCRHHEIIVTREDIRRRLPDVIRAFDEPMADPTGVPIWFLSQAAREHGVKVILNGDGPDELLLGYRNWLPYIRMAPWYRRYGRLPGVVRSAVHRLARAARPWSPTTELLRRSAAGEELFWGGARGIKESHKATLLSRDFIASTSGRSSHVVIRDLRDRFESAVRETFRPGDPDWFCYLGLKHLIPNFYAYRSDRLTMAHSVEGRSPFLDRNFVELAMSIPWSRKLEGGEPKGVLKRALEPILPREVLYRQKMGFCVPIREWGGELMSGTIRERLPDFVGKFGIFDERGVSSLVDRLERGEREAVGPLWIVYFLMLWSETIR